MDNDAMLVNETVVYEGKLHWGIFFVSGVFGLVALAGITALLMNKQMIGAACVLGVLAAFVLPEIIRYKTNGLLLTNKRVIARMGVLSRRSVDIALGKIEGVSFEQSLLGQMLDYGTVVVRGTGGGFEKFQQLAAPSEFSRQVHEQLGKPASNISS